MNIGQESGTEAKPESRYLQTVGFNTQYAVKAMKYYLTAYLQTGKTVADVQVSAWMAASF